MLAVDTSVLVAIIDDEPEAPLFRRHLSAGSGLLSTGSFVELARLMTVRGGRRALTASEALIDRWKIELVPVDREQAALAAEGALRFGKGRGRPPAVLNYGDLFAYALARRFACPLLFKGEDFAATDVVPAWRP
jgi:ribonuclease VapC